MKEKSIGRLVSILYRQSQVYLNHELKNLNISSSEYIFMMALYDYEGINQEELSTLLSIDKAATARAMKSLEEKGMVYRIKDENDKRANKVFTTDKGKSCEDEIRNALKNWTVLLTEDMEQEKIDFLINSLTSMTEKVNELYVRKSNRIGDENGIN